MKTSDYNFLTAINEFSALNIIDPTAAQKLAILRQLTELESLDKEKMIEIQDQQLSKLLVHTYLHSENYRPYLAAHMPINPSNARKALLSLPVLTRLDLQKPLSEIRSYAPDSHGEVLNFTTSGSTGQPVTVINTAAAMIIRESILLQTYLWHVDPSSGTIAIITAHSGKIPNHQENMFLENWGSPFFPLVASGTRAELNIKNPISRQVPWLLTVNPSVLVTYPSNLAQLLTDSRNHGWELNNLKHIRLIGESVSETLTQHAKEYWGISTSNVYSTEELGTVAAQCPDSYLLHLMSPAHIVEIIGSDGHPVKDNEIGKIVVTDLFNFAMPILRYEIGDTGSFSEDCQCGRKFPTMSTVLGRYRNMLYLENGERFWPKFGLRSVSELYGIKQFQVIQKNYHDLEVKFQISKVLSAEAKGQIAQTMRTSLGHHFNIDFIENYEALEGSKMGKFEEFISLIDSRASES